ncbi:hypothetical protein Tco_0613226 [Tanacetum coccineum]
MVLLEQLQVLSKDMKTKLNLDDEILSGPRSMDDERLPSPRETPSLQQKKLLSEVALLHTPAELKRMKNVPYALVVGLIMYVVRCTRPDVAFAQNITSRFQHNPGELHCTAVKNILNLNVFILNGGVVDWKSAKQSIFATSSAETEYIAAYDASKEAVWVRKFIFELGVVPTIEDT